MTAAYTVVGAGGFLGGHLASLLDAAGHAVRRLGRGDHLPDEPLGRVLWCAGVGRDFRDRVYDTARADVVDLGTLLERAELTRLVYLSSVRVYRGAAHGAPDATLRIRPQAGDDLYNATKILGEALCAASGRPEVRVARLATVCAATHDAPDVVAQLARDALRGRIELRSDLGSTRDYIQLDDATAALLALAHVGDAPVYNVASGQNVTNAELAGWLTELTGCVVDVAPDGERVTYPPIEISRSIADLGLAPRPLRAALPTIVDAQRGQAST